MTKKNNKGIYVLFIKRLLDILLSLMVLVCFCWLYAIVAILVRVKLGSPVIFKQPRPGKDEKIFNLYKFRTMTDAKDENGNLLPDEDRLPEFGKKLRATSLDELPELFNILKGDMSLVGPRPLLVKYLPLYNDEQRRRHDVRPGLTGWAQVNGRNLLSWEDKFEKDVYYVDHQSFLLDLNIIFMTVAVVFKHDDINSATDATMEAFKGTPPKDEQ
ncbi:sugar transferase [Butyrivibrio sp. VCD2006]|uniref:sugar transferase n=1 Tax=Butyrivibrio sp. VCD2006 TaxID=1280664 RepID=UPI0004190C59|nr:sugar transferase [Butyrivibrio sp. VCD2006]